MSAIASQIMAYQLFTQPIFKVQIKENIKGLHHWPLWREFTGDRWIPPQRASNAENVSIDDVLMKTGLSGGVPLPDIASPSIYPMINTELQNFFLAWNYFKWLVRSQKSL